MSAQRGMAAVFHWPAILGMASLAGLLSALVGDNAWDGASWMLLSLPVGIGLWRGWGPNPKS